MHRSHQQHVIGLSYLFETNSTHHTIQHIHYLCQFGDPEMFKLRHMQIVTTTFAPSLSRGYRVNLGLLITFHGSLVYKPSTQALIHTSLRQ